MGPTCIVMHTFSIIIYELIDGTSSNAHLLEAAAAVAMHTSETKWLYMNKKSYSSNEIQ